MPASDTKQPPAPRGALYRAVWRWHFYAGLLVAPVAIWLSITGAMYLWKPQYEAWRYRDFLNVTAPAESQPRPLEEQFAAAMSRHPQAQAVTFTPAFEPGKSSELVVRVIPPGGPANLPVWAGERTTVYVNPYTAEVLGEVAEKDRLMNTVLLLHGEMMIGKWGDRALELAASWMVALLLTGLYLWWPRPKFAVWGFLLPRLRAKGRVFWRDLHAVPAVWFSAGALFLVATGIPWTGVGGSWFKQVSAFLGEGSPREVNAAAHRSELTGWSPPLQAGLAEKVERLASRPNAPAGHGSHGSAAAPEELPADVVLPPRIHLDRAYEIAVARGVPQPFALALPVGATGVLSAISDQKQAFKRTYLHLDQYSGAVLADVRYPQFGLMGKFFLWGIAAHEGILFGLANQILGCVACLGIILMSASGVALWWQRRPAGKLGTPQTQSALPRPVFWGMIGLAPFLPLLAASLAVLFLIDVLVSRRLPWTRV